MENPKVKPINVNLNGKKIRRIVIAAVIVIAVIVFAFNCTYILNSGENAIITRFGKLELFDTQAGVRFKMPFVDKVYIINMSQIRRIEFGFKTLNGNAAQKNQYTYTNASAGNEYADMTDSTMMLTSDECLVNVEASIQYLISNAYDYVFMVENTEETLFALAESALRRTIGSHTLDEVLTDNKYIIQQEIREDLQNICDNFQMGVSISVVQLQDVNPPSAVEQAFKEVSGAREDKNSYINEATSYSNEKIPLARGNATSLVNEAEAYKQERIAAAKGEVASFEEVYKKYEDNKEIMKNRMYLEMIEEVLPEAKIYILDEKSTNTNVLLPLEGINQTGAAVSDTNNTQQGDQP